MGLLSRGFLGCWARGNHQWVYTVTFRGRAWFQCARCRRRRSGPEPSSAGPDAEVEWCLTTGETALYRAWLHFLPPERWERVFLELRRAFDDRSIEVKHRGAKDRALTAEWERRTPRWPRRGSAGTGG